MATNNSVNNILGPNNSLTMSSSGAMNLPQQPCFNCSLSTNQANTTGSGTLYTIPFDQVNVNKGGPITGGVYTAPVSGNYLFSWAITLDSTTLTSATSIIAVIHTSSESYFSNSISTTASAPVNGFTFGGSVITAMSASDTCQIDLTIYGQVTDSVTVMGNTSPIVTYFSGSMLN